MIDAWVECRLGVVSYAKNGQEMRVNCPFCSARTGREDTKQHLYISIARPVVHCFRCDWKGHHVSLVMSVEGCTYSQALSCMTDVLPDIRKYGDIYSPRGLMQGQTHASRPDGYISMLHSSNGYGREYAAVWRYLSRRRDVPLGLMVDKFGHVPGTNRAWILVDESWWQGRLIIPGESKYISPPWPRGDSLWNACALERYDTVVICEGVFSAIAVGDCAIALCGKTMSDEQAERIVRGDVPRLVVMLDADAHSNAHGVAEKLVYFGYEGELDVGYLPIGDPADGIIMSEYEPWCFESKVVKMFEFT